MPIDNRNFVIEDIPSDPEENLFPTEEDSDLDERIRRAEEDDDDRDFYQTPQPKPVSYVKTAPWERQTPTFQPSSPWGMSWGQNNNNQTNRRQNQSYNQSGASRIDRRKKIIFVDLLDILIESESAIKENNNSTLMSSNNYRKVGIMPRGLYDVRLRLEVFSKLNAFSPDYVFCITNQDKMSKDKLESWNIMVSYVMRALSDYLRLPSDNCKCLTKIGFLRSDPDVKPNCGLIKKALCLLPKTYSYQKSDIIVIGANSGYSNQSSVDRDMANKIKVDYLDVQDLLTEYS